MLIVFFVLMAAFPQLFTSTDPTIADLSKAREAPSADAWFGRDGQGYDVYARTIYGARASILVGIFATLFVAVLGSFVGIIAGYRAGWLDSLLSRIGEIFLGIPLLLGGILFLYVFPSDPLTTPFLVQVAKVALVLGLLGWPTIMRLMRSSVLQVKPNDYVQAARALGASPTRIINSHILPNSLASVIVVSTINLGVFISVEADLVLPGHRTAAAGDLLGHPDLGGLRYRSDPGGAAHADLPERLLVPDGTRVHHAGRRGPRRPRSEAALRRTR